MFELLRVFIAIVGSTIAGFYDLKTTNIPDSVAIFMIIAGFLIGAYEGLIVGDFSSLTNSAIYSSIFFLFSFMMYKTGQWGGGDGELLIGIVALLPAYSVPTLFPFPISFLINTFFVGVVYSIGFLFFYILANTDLKSNFLENFLFFLRKGIYKRIPTSKLKVDDMLGEDIPKLKLYHRVLKGLTAEEVKKIKKLKKYVTIKEGIRYGLVFPIALIITLLYGDIILLLL